MISTRRTIAIVHGGTFRGYPLGGIETFLETILPYLRSAFDVKLIGMSMGEPLGYWTEIVVKGQRLPFLPVLPQARIAGIPDRVLLMLGILKYADELGSSGADAYYVHMTEAAIGLLTMTRRPVIVHVHGLYNLFKFSRYRLGAPYARVYERFYPLLFSRCAKVIGVGSSGEFRDFACRMKIRSGAAIPTCVRADIFHPCDRSQARRALGLNPTDKVVLFVGRMTSTKNPRLLLDTVSFLRPTVPNLTAVFIGDGPMKEEIADAAKVVGNTLVVGRKDSSEVAQWMNAADALTVVSKAEAFTSIAALEALSCGTPVVATPVSALPDVLRNGINGAVAAELSVEAYARALHNVLMARIDRTSCTASVRSYTPEIVARQIIEQIGYAIKPELDS